MDVTDSIGNFGSASVTYVVCDPEGGFVTGAGWIDSPGGAYKADPAIVGKATFGFNSKYKQSATVPTGTAEFQLHDAKLSFHSTSYDWLVVNQNGTDAQLKGTGTIDGAGTYEFMLWIGDGAPDTFRIKIWAGGANGVEDVVYDNGADLPARNGNIMIHSK